MYLCSILTLILTTMAIVKNFWLKGSKKRLGGAVLYQAMGQTRSRELASEVSNPRTAAQMSQRIKWSNLVNFYRANASWMRYAFENKKSNQSEYNAFMSKNVSGSPIALTKDMAASGAVVVYPYQLTQGSLPSVEWLNAPTELQSNIFINPGSTTDEYIEVGEFSDALLNNNAGLREGDQLSFIRITQLTNSSTGYPYVIVRKYELILDRQSGESLNKYWPIELFSTRDIGDNTVLTINKENRQGGFCMIISRTTGGRTFVSSQTLVPVNMEPIIANYSSSSAIQAAIDSYGESSDAFLSSVSARTIDNAPVSLSINYMEEGGVNYSPGATTPTMAALESKQIRLYFSDTLPNNATITGRAVVLQGSTLTLTGFSSQVNMVQFTVPQAPQAEGEKHLYSVIVTVNGTDYAIVFASSNDYTIEGLE